MNAVTETKAAPKQEAKKPTGLDLLREPFPPHQISKLPKPTKAQTDEVRNNFKAGIRCDICGAWHHPKVVHLDYVGHAALTDRLLDADPQWNWEPMAFTDAGTPALDQNSGMWIKLTVCGVTRFGYGHAEGKKGGDMIKEVIGDALRNAAMRFGAALDLWHKGDLHGLDDAEVEETPPPARQERAPAPDHAAIATRITAKLEKATSEADYRAKWSSESDALTTLRDEAPGLFEGVKQAGARVAARIKVAAATPKTETA